MIKTKICNLSLFAALAMATFGAPYTPGQSAGDDDLQYISKSLTPEKRQEFLTPGGRYTEQDIKTNLANHRFGVILSPVGMTDAAHDPAKPGEYVCPISPTVRPEKKFSWTIGGHDYVFCCSMCIASFLKTAKTAPETIHTPAYYIVPFGGIQIAASGVKDTVLVDKWPKGPTPITLSHVATGSHTIVVKTEDGRMFKKVVNLYNGDTENITVQLRPLPATINVTAVTAQGESVKAELLIDGKRSDGVTPLTLDDLEPGSHRIQVRAKRYATSEQSINVTTGQTLPVTFSLQPSGGDLTISETGPDGAERHDNIYLDGVDSGAAPQTIVDLATGDHKVEVHPEGYVPFQQNVTLVAAQPQSITAALKQLGGAVSISATGPGGEMVKGEVSIDGKPYDSRTPMVLTNIEPGDHKIVVKAPAYGTSENVVAVVSQQTRAVVASMQKTGGTAKILVHDDKGAVVPAEILVDGKSQGTVSSVSIDLDAGTHDIEVKTSGYVSYKGSLIVTAGQDPALPIVLQLLGGTVDVDATDTKGAKIKAQLFVDSKPVGVTPFTGLHLDPGTYRLQVKAENYKSYDERLTVVAGEKYSLPIHLAESTGAVRIDSPDSNIVGEVLVDGKSMGNTPQTVNILSLGSHKVEIKTVGFPDFQQSVTVSAEQVQVVTGVLRKLTGGIQISLNDPAVQGQVFVDGKWCGAAPLNLNNLTAGQHMVEVKADGFDQPYQKIVTVSDGQTQFLLAVFKKKLDASVPAEESRKLFLKTQFGEAMSKAREALTFDPDNAMAHGILANSILLQENFSVAQQPEAEAEIRKALAAAKTDRELSIVSSALGVIDTNRNLYDAADREFRNAIVKDPSFIAAYAEDGFLWAKQKKWQDAVKMYSQAVELDPLTGDYELWLADALWHQKDTSHAKTAAVHAADLGFQNTQRNREIAGRVSAH